MLQATTTELTDYSTIYVGEPDIPIGMTVSSYRQSRPHTVAWWRSLPGVSGARGPRFAASRASRCAA
jgi:hypothetical protein